MRLPTRMAKSHWLTRCHGGYGADDGVEEMVARSGVIRPCTVHSGMVDML